MGDPAPPPVQPPAGTAEAVGDSAGGVEVLHRAVQDHAKVVVAAGVTKWSTPEVRLGCVAALA